MGGGRAYLEALKHLQHFFLWLPGPTRDDEKDEDEVWQRLCEEVFAIADDQEECNRPE